MKHITLQIPENKYAFFMELLRNFDFVKIEDEAETEIPEEHKEIVRERIKKSANDPSRLQKWDDIKREMKF